MKHSIGAAVIWPLLALSAVPLAGCVFVTSGCEQASFKETRTLTLPYSEGSGLDVETHNGQVSIAKAGETDVVITAKLAAVSAERLAAAVILAEPNAKGDLEVRVQWPEDRRKGNESCSLEIVTPGVSTTKVRSSNGRIALTGLAGPAELRTSNGTISVKDHDGKVTAHTSNGEVTLINVLAADAESSNGAIEVRLAKDAPGPVLANTSNGAISLQVGEAFSGSLRATTSNGRISNSVAAAKVTGTPSKTAMSYEFGSSGPESRLRTSNGAINIESTGS
jgi:DUF4097 and DUF4098 domain-containing protein YvlB